MFIYNIYFILTALALIIPSFFVLRYIFKRRDIQRASGFAIFILVVFAVVLSVVFAVFNSKVLSKSIRAEKFDTSKWQADKWQRFRMVNDIIDNNLLMGKKRQDVIEMLGTDFEEGPCVDCLGYSTCDPDDPGFLDHEVIEIMFDEKGEVYFVRKMAW